jgi:hypothetical protein
MPFWACRSPRINPPAAAAAAVRPFYSNFDWLDYGLILLVNFNAVPVEIKRNISTKIEWSPFPLSITSGLQSSPDVSPVQLGGMSV